MKGRDKTAKADSGADNAVGTVQTRWAMDEWMNERME